MLQAAHIVAKEFDGTDDPRNGLMLCANHHAAFDAKLFTIHQDTLKIVPLKGETLSTLQILLSTLEHLEGKPAREAIEIHNRTLEDS